MLGGAHDLKAMAVEQLGCGHGEELSTCYRESW